MGKAVLATGVFLVLLAGALITLALLVEDNDATERLPAAEDPVDNADEPAEPAIETVAEGFDQPWGLAFLPGTEQLVVTQLPGALSVVDTASGEVRDIGGVPDVAFAGQGGLLDVAVHPDFPEPDWLYLTYAAADEAGATTTHLARARLDLDGERLDDVEVLFTAEPFRTGEQHYGSRVVVGPDSMLYVSVGDRGDKDFDDHPSQDTATTLGSTVRLAPDGAIPDDNPFVDDPAVADEIYSYGHRNAQGMAVHPATGQLWQSEHGEEDGDEINIVEAGGNYGWPEAHTGCEYGTDTPIGDHPAERDDIVDPVHYWECGTGGFPPAGITFYEGDQFPDWQGDLLVSGLVAGDGLARFTVDGAEADHAETLLTEQDWRIRDVESGPDGAVYIAIDDEDTPLVRLVAAGE
ncbi:PQQ-dependent sugar dehydrogenase [Haloechinothrix sp. LS1_15]|uniref:PQQ-dependent sugar dehydrogenase n=1 Tax=Haloechinothrix sp. LS1_15 TaxID=2652248 RepID=UPI002947A2F0|nr:PQQ-dependent sugar dehydrogenase [Haloechinothrix sp. LS1_15]MDV6014712.1 PQQ-dependent sugar dehydrogenase [Haloechinothrix sp. LS1_15]